MDKSSRIYIAGHKGLVGSAILRRLQADGYKNLIFRTDDLADACLYLMNNYNGDGIVNIGVGKDLTIKELAEMIGRIVGFKGILRFDTSKPDGTPQKLLDISKLNSLGWKAKIELEDGISMTYRWYLEQIY